MNGAMVGVVIADVVGTMPVDVIEADIVGAGGVDLAVTVDNVGHTASVMFSRTYT